MATTTCTITLSIREIPDKTPSGEASEKVFQFSVKVGEEELLHDHVLSRNDSRKVRELRWRYVDFFGWDRIEVTTLKEYGKQLSSLWLGEVWPKIKLLPSKHKQILIASTVPDVLNLPWELVYPPGLFNYLGIHKDFDVRRLPWIDPPVFSPLNLTPGPLRILFMACGPKNQTELAYEEEEYSVLKAISKVNDKVIFHSGDLGMDPSMFPQWRDDFTR
jgi:hypothetical protein